MNASSHLENARRAITDALEELKRQPQHSPARPHLVFALHELDQIGKDPPANDANES